MSFTRDTSHLEMSPLNDVAPIKMVLISVMLDTSHSPIGPCRPSEQSPFSDNFRQVVTALLSFALDCGENMDWPARESVKMATRSAKKITCRWYDGKQGTCPCIKLSLCRFAVLCKCESALIIRVHSQSYSSPETSKVRICVVMTIVPIKLSRWGSRWGDSEWLLPLTVWQEVACTSLGHYALRWGEWWVVFTLCKRVHCSSTLCNGTLQSIRHPITRCVCVVGLGIYIASSSYRLLCVCHYAHAYRLSWDI